MFWNIHTTNQQPSEKTDDTAGTFGTEITIKTKAAMVGIPGVKVIAESNSNPSSVEELNNDGNDDDDFGSLFVAPGSVYRPPEDLGEVTVNSIPYDVQRLALTPNMKAESINGGFAQPQINNPAIYAYRTSSPSYSMHQF
jgi:hypothetical protein